MKRHILMMLGLLSAVLLALMMGCKSDQTTAPQGHAKISGTISDAGSGSALAGVTILAQTLTNSQTYTTVGDGIYTFSFDVDSTDRVTLSLSKSGYRDTTIIVPIQSGTVVSLSVLLNPKSVITSNGGGTGLAHTIALLSIDLPEIRVYGVGGQERAIVSWEARDSLGLAIDAAHAVDITFAILSGPNGGEYLSPTTVRTNALGQASITVNSGIKSGVMQIAAQATVNGVVIWSNPIRIIIDAGFPVQTHFSVGPARHNFPVLHWLGKTDAIAVLVGDIYSNPVEPSTAVYFHTSPYPVGEIGGAGVIEASVFTDKDGEGSANLISGNPLPFGNYAAAPGNGYHWVVAQTVGQGGAVVRDSTMILWSGYSQINNFTPNTFNIPNGGFQDFTFTVSDELGHPLAAGTTVAITLKVPPPPSPDTPVNQVQISYDSSTLNDELFPGPGITDYAFRLSDGSTNIDQATPVTVTITVTSENGNIHASINGTVY